MRHLTAAAVVTAALLVPSVAAAAPVRECGNHGKKKNGEYGWTYGRVSGPDITLNVKARRVRCRTARLVALRAFGFYPGAGPRWSYGSWRCRVISAVWRVPNTRDSENRCVKRGGRVVRWRSIYTLPTPGS